MKPVDQTELVEAGDVGDCYAACIASILERPLADLAEFHRLYVTFWIAQPRHRDYSLQRAYYHELHRLGVHPAYIPVGEKQLGATPAGYSIASGRSPRGVDHACVALDGVTIHDPHPSRAGLLEITDYEVLVPVVEP